VDDGKGVKGGTVVTGGGGESTDLLAGWLDVGAPDPFGGVWDALVGEVVSWVGGGCGQLNKILALSSRCWGTKPGRGEWKGCRRRR